MAIILIVDDTLTHARLVQRMLMRHGYQVLVAQSAEEGLEVALERKPDLILMDVVMPGINGYQATRELKENILTARIPVVMVSTKDMKVDRMWGISQGACEYLVKPVQEQALLRTVGSLLRVA